MQTSGSKRHGRYARVVEPGGIVYRTKSLQPGMRVYFSFVLGDPFVRGQHAPHDRMTGIDAGGRPIEVPLHLRRVIPQPGIQLGDLQDVIGDFFLNVLGVLVRRMPDRVFDGAVNRRTGKGLECQPGRH